MKTSMMRGFAALLLISAALAAPLAASAADLTVTAASVVPSSGASLETGTAGEAVTAGQLVYKKAADSHWYKADCNSVTAEVRVASAVAITGSAAGQPVVVQKGGAITIGATMTANTVYYLSGSAAGGIRPAADNVTGDYPQVVGMATSTTVMQLNFGLHATAPL